MVHPTPMPMSSNQEKKGKDGRKRIVLGLWKAAYVYLLCGKNMRNKSGNIHVVGIDKILILPQS